MNKRYKRSGGVRWQDYLQFQYSSDYLSTSGFNVKPLFVGLPYPITTPHQAAPSHETDTVQTLLKEKSEYAKLKSHAKKEYKVSKSRIVTEAGATTTVPLHIMNYYKAKDPDVYFKCDYNYYYTGGDLEHFYLNGHEYLIRPHWNNRLVVSDLNNLQHTLQFYYRNSKSVCNLKAYPATLGVYLLIRHKCELDLLLINGLETDTFKTVWEHELVEVPFLDAKLSSDEKTCVTVNANKYLRLRNLEKNKTTYNYLSNSKQTVDQFCQVDFMGNHKILLVDRSWIKIIDTRAKNVAVSHDTRLEPCNGICSQKLISNTLLLGTRHDFVKYDLRKLNGDYENCSHYLSAPPSYLDVTNGEDDTFICLSAQNVTQKVLFGTNSVNKLPLEVPSVLDTLKECRLRKETSLKNHVDDRLSFSTTGIKLIDTAGKIVLYSKNCTGDLFKQHVTHETPGMYEPISFLYDWVEDLKVPEQRLLATDVVDMSSLRFNLQKESALNEEFAPVIRNKYFLRKSWRRFRDEKYGGTVGDFMAVWRDDGEESENYDEEDGSQSSIELPSHVKVNDWIQSHDFDNAA